MGHLACSLSEESLEVVEFVLLTGSLLWRADLNESQKVSHCRTSPKNKSRQSLGDLTQWVLDGGVVPEDSDGAHAHKRARNPGSTLLGLDDGSIEYTHVNNKSSACSASSASSSM